MWAQLIKNTLICLVLRRVGTQLMPCICISGGHFAIYGDLEKGAYRVVLAVTRTWHELCLCHIKFLLHMTYKKDFSVGKKFVLILVW